ATFPAVHAYCVRWTSALRAQLTGLPTRFEREPNQSTLTHQVKKEPQITPITAGWANFLDRFSFCRHFAYQKAESADKPPKNTWE
ncbi:MAG TPA: hypothetical protein PLM19_05705, partial [Candidatus Syntrophosphaera sp.]|nr:hypothetical protein [Candidatus Syntrophosphaera sp.]